MKTIIIFFLTTMVANSTFAHPGHGSSSSIVHSVEHGIWYLLSTALLLVIIAITIKLKK